VGGGNEKGEHRTSKGNLVIDKKMGNEAGKRRTTGGGGPRGKIEL